MARSSDIEFGKLALMFGFTSKEKMYAALRETAVLQEMGIAKRVSHIVYEREFLTPKQVQAILWTLYCNHKIDRFPARVVYEFTEEDDKKFLEKVMAPLDLTLSTIRDRKRNDDFIFPQDVLIYCLDIQKQLHQKGFPRTLLSILSAKGYLQDAHRKLVPDIESKKKVIASPDMAKSAANRRLWEATLFAAIAAQKTKLTPEDIQKAEKIWQKLGEWQLSLKYSELLHYLGVITKGDLTKLGVFLSEVANIDQIPQFSAFDLDEEEKNFVQQELSKEARYQKAYHECTKLSAQLKAMGVDIAPENLLIHKKQITRAEIQAKKGKIAALDHLPKGLAATENRPVPEQRTHIPKIAERELNLSRKIKKELTRKMMPFSMDVVEKEFSSQYLEERKNIRHRPEGNINAILQEISQTQMIPFKEFTFSATEDVPLSGSQIRMPLRSDSKSAGLPAIPVSEIHDTQQAAQTEYLSLDALPKKGALTGKKDSEDRLSIPAPDGKAITQTGYFSLSADDIKKFTNKVAHSMGPQRSFKLVLLAFFIVGAGIAMVEPKYQELFPHADPIFTKVCHWLASTFPVLQESLEHANHLPIYTALSMLIVFLPCLFVGDWFGKLADKGYSHVLLVWGFLIYGLSLPFLPFFGDIVDHSIVRFVQGIGLAAIFVAGEFSISRWYGPLERGRYMGFAIMVFTLGFCLGFELPLIFDEFATNETILGIKLSGLFLASAFWAFISLLTILFVYRLRINKVTNEDAEEETEAIVIPKKPLIAAALYGLTEVALFAVFFPCFPKEVPIWGNISTDELVLLFGIGVLLSSYILGWLSDQIGPAPLLTALSLLAVFTFCALPWAGTSSVNLLLLSVKLVDILFLCVGIVLGGLYPLGFSWLLEMTDNERYFGKASGLFAVYEGAGSMCGCFLFGVVFTLWGINGFFFLLSMIFVGYFYLLSTSPRKESARIGGEDRRVRGLLGLLQHTE